LTGERGRRIFSKVHSIVFVALIYSRHRYING
jgi:hypothetical protein